MELAYRLPRLWDLLKAGSLQAWKARRVAAHTQPLSMPAAGSGGTCPPWSTRRCCATIRRSPRVSRRPRWRRGECGSTTAPVTPAGRPAPGSSWPNWTSKASATLYLHLDAADLAAHVRDGETTMAGRVERLGAGSLDLLRDWLGRAQGVTIRPVLDPSRLPPVDRHDPPAAMREAVILRDGHCVFPGCSTDARACDLDHIRPYISLAEAGPPGQTTTENLACLCRRHHRLKTLTGWRYHRLTDGPPGQHSEWTSPTARPT